MAHVILQPCGEGAPSKHFLDTVEELVSLNRMAKFISHSERQDLEALFPNGNAAVWGVTPGKKSTNAKKWARMQVGDIALFSRGGKIFSKGTVAYKLHSAELARELWPSEEDPETWEYMYLLKNIHPVDIGYAEFNLAVGYQPNYIIRGFDVLPDDKSAKALALIDGFGASNESERELEAIRLTTDNGAFDPSSEGEGRQKVLASICRRQGQPEFRAKLIAAYGGRCAITGCDAIQTLEAAHIVPYDGPKTNHPANGLLLRSDFHNLFDLSLFSIDPTNLEVRLSPALKKTVYANYDGKKIHFPADPKLRPNCEALTQHKKKCNF